MSKSHSIQEMKKTSSMLDLVHKSKGQLIAPREVIDRIAVLAPDAVKTLEELMHKSKADSVRLKAAMEILALAGVTKETRLTVTTKVEELDEESLDTRLSDLLSRAQGVVIEGESRDITPVELH